MTVPEALKQIAAGQGDPSPLAVTFDDLHGLWGGLRLTIHGTGQVDQKAVREQVGKPRKVYRKQLNLLAALLVKQAAWEQRTPERTAQPDKSRAYLTIEYGTLSTVIWEWYNELEQNRPIGEIRDFMKQIAWNHAESGVAGPTLPPEIHAVTVHGITAHFGGDKPPVEINAPQEFGVEALWFTFEGDARSYVFKPKGELSFGDWSFGLFSPDGAHVLLLQDHYGPYHVVATDRLKDHLIGRAKPDYVVTERGKMTDPAKVHSGGRWISATEIQFTVACCGSRETLAYRLGQKQH